jgi:hypothetical protein
VRVSKAEEERQCKKYDAPVAMFETSFAETIGFIRICELQWLCPDARFREAVNALRIVLTPRRLHEPSGSRVIAEVVP